MSETERQKNPSDISEEISSFDHLVDLCQRGMLYEAEEWLKEGYVATQPVGSGSCPLRWAAKRGFHSLVKLLLRYHCTENQKLGALEVAASDGNFDICELLVEAGAPVERLHYENLDDVIRRPLIEYLLDHGLDLAQHNGLANLLVYRRVKPLLGIFLQYRNRFPEWEEQAAMALCEFIRNNDKKWISLMIWAGADPFLPVHDISATPYKIEDDEWKRTAVRCASWSDDPEILKMLKLKPTPEQASEVLFATWYRPCKSMVENLIEAGADVNTYTAEEGSLLHIALHSFSVRDEYWRPRISSEEEVELISMLIRRGATWRLPDYKSALNGLRRHMYSQEGPHVVEIIRLLHAGACCDIAQLKAFADKPKMRGWVRSYDPKLFRDLGL